MNVHLFLSKLMRVLCPLRSSACKYVRSDANNKLTFLSPQVEEGAVNSVSFSGWMKKKGNTSHAMTASYQRRWFELEDKVLTYFVEIPGESKEGKSRKSLIKVRFLLF